MIIFSQKKILLSKSRYLIIIVSFNKCQVRYVKMGSYIFGNSFNCSNLWIWWYCRWSSRNSKNPIFCIPDIICYLFDSRYVQRIQIILFLY